MKKTTYDPPHNIPIAIIGVGCFFPKASGLKAYWRLLFHGIDAITDVPASHWSIEDYFDADPKTKDKVYCTRGGFLSPIDFDPAEYGIPPNTLEATDTSQLLGLVAARMALDDAGYGEPGRPFNRDRTSVILGVTGTQELVIPLGARLGHPKWRQALKDADVPADKSEEVIERISSAYVSWQENSFPGLLGNVVAGRISNRLDLGGTNCVVDAACASSMSAIHLATMELTTHRCDMVLTGGVDTLNDIFMHMCFGQTGILSPTGDIRPFSKDADGTLLGEGVGIMALKRLPDAERDNDRIYAVIRAVGTSSDGRSQSIYAPRKEGQVKALRRAYDTAAIDPSTIDLVEAHGTGTRVGDQTEFQTLTDVFSPAHPEKSSAKRPCALGTVKSMIGHSKAAAGSAGLIKMALALHHKTLPPTLKATPHDPDLYIDRSPFYLSTHTRPWISSSAYPRRGGVSAFGFGGSNFHIVMEEHAPDKTVATWDGSVEIISLSADTQAEISDALSDWGNKADDGLSDEQIAFYAAQSRNEFKPANDYRLLLVVDRSSGDKPDLKKVIDDAAAALETADPDTPFWVAGNTYFGRGPLPGKLAFVFPGQGSQYVNMARDLVCIFPEAMDAMEQFNARFEKDLPLSDYIYPHPAPDKRGQLDQETKLRSTDVAQPAIGAVSMAMYRILTNFGVRPDMVCGHSYGELAALLAGGWLPTDAFYQASIARGKLMAAAGKNPDGDPGAMLAVKAPLADLQSLVDTLDSDVILANRNSPTQGVLSGSKAAIEAAEVKCRELKFKAIRLPVAAAFHSHLVAGAQKPFRRLLDDFDLTPSDVPVFSNTTGDAYPMDIETARDTLGNQLINPVDFVANVENQYRSGVRTFVEIGPRAVLTGLIRQILRKQDHTVMAVDASNGKKPGLLDLAKCFSHLAALGYPVQFNRWDPPPSSGNRRKPIMRIPIGGANYTNPQSSPQSGKMTGKKKESAPDNTVNTKKAPVFIPSPSPKKMDANMSTHKLNNAIGPTLKQQSARRPATETVTDTLEIIREGLKSIQEIQTRTARAHEMFLETQAEASRVLQSLITRTRDTAQQTGIVAMPETEKRDALWETTIADPGQPSESLSDPANLPDRKDRFPNMDPDSQSTSVDASLPDSVKNSDSVVKGLFDVISELTGYPAEMLKLDMDIEADLGIDSIKRVEILSTLEERKPELPAVSPEHMGELKTLGQIADYLCDNNYRPLPAGSDRLYDEKVEIESEELYLSKGYAAKVEPTLMNVVSELTGYPVEMLKPHMNIEADLGVDSIKRVEILSALEERIPELPAIAPEDMGELKTLGQIVDYLTSPDTHEGPERLAIASSKPEANPAEVNPTVLGRTDPGITNRSGIKRQIVTVQTAEFSSSPSPRSREIATIVITDDGNGLSQAIASAFSDRGVATTIIPTDSDALNRVPDPIGGFIPVLPPNGQIDFNTVRQIFRLVKTAGKRFLGTAAQTHRLFAAVTRIDGAFGFSGKGIEEPLQGALPGLVKTAAIEWPGVHCRALDVAPDWHDHPAISRAVVNVLTNSDSNTPLEIGLHPDLAPDQHYVLSLKEKRIPDQRPALSPEDVMVVSGGARGITAEAVIALARETGATFALLGRSPEPGSTPDWIDDFNDPAAVKKAILANDFNHHPPSPASLERAFHRYGASHGIKRTLDTLKDIGVKASYYPIDVTNGDEVMRTLDRIRTDLGPVTGLIHGAGILQDSLIVDKPMEAFDRVFNTKVKGLRHLLQATRNESLRHLILFSSVSARFGNGGQSDYAMANEVLNKIAQAESIARPECKVASINWGPWEGGMVSPSLKRVFAQRGIELIPAPMGGACFVREMGNSMSGPVEIVIGSRLGKNDAVVAEMAPAENKKIDSTEKMRLSFRREVDLHRYPVLKSHILNGRPVVPFALMTEWFAHGALHENPGLILHGIDDMRLLKGIHVDEGSKTIRLMAGKARPNENRFEVPVELRDGMKDGVDVIHSRGKAILVEALNQAPSFTPPPELTATPYHRSIDDVYETILFHGEHLRGLKSILGLTEKGMMAEINSAPQPDHWVIEPLRSTWLADPLALDTAFQMASVWCYEQKGMVSLPSYSASYRQFARRFPPEGLKVILEVYEVTSGKMTGDFTFIDSDGNVVARLSGYEAVMDVSLYQSFKPHFSHSSKLKKGLSAA